MLETFFATFIVWHSLPTVVLPECHFLINELNANTAQQIESLEFIEIKTVNCFKAIDLSGQRVMLIQGIGTSNWPEMIGYIEIPSCVKRLENHLYLIGDDQFITTPDL